MCVWSHKLSDLSLHANLTLKRNISDSRVVVRSVYRLYMPYSFALCVRKKKKEQQQCCIRECCKACLRLQLSSWISHATLTHTRNVFNSTAVVWYAASPHTTYSYQLCVYVHRNGVSERLRCIIAHKRWCKNFMLKYFHRLSTLQTFFNRKFVQQKFHTMRIIRFRVCAKTRTTKLWMGTKSGMNYD